jgi:hypothetical protein
MTWAAWFSAGMMAASVVIAAFNAWQNKCIELAIEKLRSSLVERIAKAEGRLDALAARQE